MVPWRYRAPTPVPEPRPPSGKEAIREQSLRHQGHQPGRRGPGPHSLGRPRHAGARSYSRALRRGAPAGGRAHRRVHARDHRDGEPHARSCGLGCRGDLVRLEPAVHPGRHRRLPRARLRRVRVRHRRRGRRDLRAPHRRGGGHQPADHHGRRRRSGYGPAHQVHRQARRGHRRHRGDDHRRGAPHGHGRRGRAGLSRLQH